MQHKSDMYVYLISPRNRRLYIRYEYIYGYYYACKEGDMQHKSDIYICIWYHHEIEDWYIWILLYACKEKAICNTNPNIYIYIDIYLIFQCNPNTGYVHIIYI